MLFYYSKCFFDVVEPERRHAKCIVNWKCHLRYGGSFFFSALKNEQLNEIGKLKCTDIKMSTPLQSVDIAHNYSTSATLIHCHGLNSAKSEKKNCVWKRFKLNIWPLAVHMHLNHFICHRKYSCLFYIIIIGMIEFHDS